MKIEALYRRLLFSVAMFFCVWLLGGIGFWAIGQFFHRAAGEFDPSGDYQFTVLNSLYMAAITVSTVGYGEVTNFHAYLTDTGEDIATAYTAGYCLLAYLVVIYASANIVAALVEGAIGKALMQRRMKKMLEALDQHYIVCGAGATGKHIVDELEKVGEKLVVIDGSTEALSHFEGKDGVILLSGDATDEQLLRRAGIERARGVFAVLHDDKDNVFLVLTARQANAKARIIGRVTSQENVHKLKSVGADAVVSPNHIGGLRMASEMVRPSVVSFLDKMLRATDSSLRFNEVLVDPGSKAAGRSLGELYVRENTGLEVIGVYRADKTIVYNPAHDTKVNGGDALIVICNAEQLKDLTRHIAEYAPREDRANEERQGGALGVFSKVFHRKHREPNTPGQTVHVHKDRYSHMPKELVRSGPDQATGKPTLQVRLIGQPSAPTAPTPPAAPVPTTVPTAPSAGPTDKQTTPSSPAAAPLTESKKPDPSNGHSG